MAHRLLLSRRDLGMNQAELSRLSGVSRTYISEIERGKISNVGVDVVFKLASSLGVGVGYLLGLTDDPLGDLEAMGGASDMSDDMRELVDLYASLNRANRELLLALAKAIGDNDPAYPGEKHGKTG